MSRRNHAAGAPRLPIVRRRPATARAAFSLLELLGIILILSFLVAMIFPALNRLHTTMARRRAAAEARMLVDAVLYYRRVYDAWPGVEAAPADILFGDPSLPDNEHLPDQARLIGALAVTNTVSNPRRIRFLELPADRIENGRFRDPWNRAYLVALDGNLDGWVTVTHPAPLLGIHTNLPALALSLGEPGAAPNPVYSWSTR